MNINFIGPFERFTYRNTYIYNLVNHFLRYIYPYFTVGININNIILLFNYYLQANYKLYMVYIDISLYFIR